MGDQRKNGRDLKRRWEAFCVHEAGVGSLSKRGSEHLDMPLDSVAYCNVHFCFGVMLDGDETRICLDD